MFENYKRGTEHCAFPSISTRTATDTELIKSERERERARRLLLPSSSLSQFSPLQSEALNG